MTQRPRILIVDDEPFNLDYLEQELDDLGYASIRATNGKQALELAGTESPDMLLLDIMMPEMDGFQVLARLKADATLRDIPVVIISALTDLQSIVTAIKAGADDYLPKPFNLTLLQARLQNGLEKKRLRDQEQLYLHGLERELKIGREIQAGFLPAALPQVAGWEIAAYFQAAREVAGDLYDVFALPQINRIGLLIGDVCDKGVGAALFMTLFRSLLRAGIEMDRWTEPDPMERNLLVRENDAARLTHSLTLTNNYIAQMHGETGMFATIFFGLLDPVTGELVYINAGHEEPLVLSQAGILKRLSRTAISVGLLAETTFQSRRLQLERGETLLLLTDGVSDSQNENGEVLSREKLMTWLELPGHETANSLVRRLASNVSAHIGKALQFDDITLMAIKRDD